MTTATVQWITTGYLLMLALVIPASSYLKRRFAMKALFLTAALLFLLGTVLAAAAPSFSWLLGGRLIQGVGTGLALPLMFNIVLEQAPLDKMGLMIGVASLITAVAPAVGPFAGGAIVEAFGWRMILWCCYHCCFCHWYSVSRPSGRCRNWCVCLFHGWNICCWFVRSRALSLR